MYCFNIKKLFSSFFSLSATVTIVCLYTPKLYIILLHPEKNIRQSMMNQSKYNDPSTKKNSTHNPTNVKNGPEPLNVNGGIKGKKVLQNGTYLTQIKRTYFKVWKIKNFPATHILCEMNFSELKVHYSYSELQSTEVL